MVTINPADCPPDRVYMGIVNGRREVMCRFPHRELPWETFANVHADDSVSDLVPLVEARPITRDEQGEMWARIRDELRGEYPSATDYDHRKLDLAASASADAVVEYLNDRGGLGIDTREPLERALRERDSFRCDLDWARGKCDELRSLIEEQGAADTDVMRSASRSERTAERHWPADQLATAADTIDSLRAHLDRMERERDAAAERAEQAERDRDEAMSQRETQRTNARRARRARDEWQARTEESERVNESLRDVIEQQAKSTGSGLVHTHGFENSPEGGCNELTLEDGRIIGSCMLPETLRTTLDELTVRLALVQSGRDHYKTMWEGVEKADFAKRERIEELKRQIAELREPRVDASSDDPPAPAVSRADIEKAVRSVAVNPIWEAATREIIDAVWALVSGTDPAVYVVRESEVDAVEVKRTQRPSGSYRWDSCDGTGSAVPDGDEAADNARKMVELRAKGLVSALAVQRAIEAGQAEDPVEELAEELMRVLAPETEDRTWGILTEPAREDFRRLARHVLGQEADHA